jgi:hypothetical protein
VLLFGFQGEQIVRQPVVIGILATPIFEEIIEFLKVDGCILPPGFFRNGVVSRPWCSLALFRRRRGGHEQANSDKRHF